MTVAELIRRLASVKNQDAEVRTLEATGVNTVVTNDVDWLADESETEGFILLI